MVILIAVDRRLFEILNCLSWQTYVPRAGILPSPVSGLDPEQAALAKKVKNTSSLSMQLFQLNFNFQGSAAPSKSRGGVAARKPFGRK